MLGEQPPEPGAARPHDHVGLEHAAVVEPRGGARPGGAVAADEPRAVRRGLARERPHRALRAQHARLRLVQQEREAARRSSSGTGARPPSGASRSYGMPCASNVAIVCASQPSSRCANHVSPHSISSSSPHSASSSRHSVRARRAEAV